MSKFKKSTEMDLTLCVAGNMLGRNPGYVTTQGLILADLLKHERYRVICTSSRVNRLLRLADIVQTLIRHRNDIDISLIEVYSGRYFFLVDLTSLLARFFGIPMIFVLHGGNLAIFSIRFRTWAKRVLRRANILVAPSPFLAKGLAGIGFAIRVVPNIVEIVDYPFRARRKIQPKLLWMRAFQELYNPQMAVDVFEAVKRKYPQASLVMAGVDKGLEPESKRAVKEKGLEDSVRFPGFLDQKAKVREFSEADVFLNTNHIDNMPVAVVEACASGLPVVATCVGGIPDLIRNGEEGLLVPDNDVQGMAEAVCSLIENPELAERLSTNGRLLAERSEWDAVRPEWEKLFKEVLQKKNGLLQISEPRQVSNQ
jgi:glycosyltransferase involved in cell wall biosynthesis